MYKLVTWEVSITIKGECISYCNLSKAWIKSMSRWCLEFIMVQDKKRLASDFKNTCQCLSDKNPICDVAVSMLCGAMAGALAKTAVAPIERIKMSFQISSNAFSLSRAFRHGEEIIRYNGFISLWRGHSATLVRVVPLAGISFAAHDYSEVELKKILHKERLPMAYKFLAGAIAGTSGTLITYPLDVMRVRLALIPGSDWLKVLRKGGLFQGLSPTVLGIVPYAGTAWMTKQTLLESYSSVKRRNPFLIESLVINAIAG